MPQRILVLGASGYIGQHLVRTLSQQGHQILAAARHVDRLAKLQLANVSCHKVDLSWPDNLPALLQDIDTVYFLVHSMGEGGDFIAQERQVALNVRDALREVPVKQLIFLSSLHRTVRFRQVFACVRYDLCGGTAALYGVFVFLCKTVLRTDGKTGCRVN